VLPLAVGNHVPGLRRLELPAEPPSRDIWMGYHRDLKHLQRLRAFIQTVETHLRAVLP
jgi:DNA-binding transcriptional LysR family regulator